MVKKAWSENWLDDTPHQEYIAKISSWFLLPFNCSIMLISSLYCFNYTYTNGRMAKTIYIREILRIRDSIWFESSNPSVNPRYWIVLLLVPVAFAIHFILGNMNSDCIYELPRVIRFVMKMTGFTYRQFDLLVFTQTPGSFCEKRTLRKRS